MSREIGFRAKTIDGIWFYWKLTDPINMGEMKEAIDWSTFGQDTGLKDKNEKRIFEGDIVKTENGRIWSVQNGEYITSSPSGRDEYFGWHLCPIEKELQDFGNYKLLNKLVVIGNIYDNPELLEPDAI